MTLGQDKKRARSEGEKAHRKAMILGAAREMITEAGVDSVTMSRLATRAGLAKGTLYLYFRTKEELFLSLFVAAMERFAERFEAEVIRATDLPEELTRIALETPLFVALYGRLVAVIEANVADPPLFAAKREIDELRLRFLTHLGSVLGLDQARASAVTGALMLAMQGAAQFDISARRDPATLPEDLRPLYAGYLFTESFPAAARVVLSGVV